MEKIYINQKLATEVIPENKENEILSSLNSVYCTAIETDSAEKRGGKTS